MLENGAVFCGQAAGKFKETVCEVIFNTSMTGYVEMLSDPSNAGLGVVMTYPLIGNYGVCLEDMESDKLYPAALLVHELCDTPSNFRCEMTLEEFLVKHEIPCVTGLDNRAIVMNVRENGAMKAIVTDDISDKDALLNKIKSFELKNEYTGVNEVVSEDGVKVAFIDIGARKSFVKAFAQRGFAVTKFAALNADEILNGGFEGVVISNGVEDHDKFADTVEEIKKLMAKNMPIFAIGLGHQLVALANGGKVEKMLHGHRGCNYPVRFNDKDKTYITAHNHGFTVTEAPANADVLCVNVNDKTIEGLKYQDKPVMTVQFIPDTSKGPNTAFLFEDFKNLIKEGK
jgi:carbamoyl-phosphate synthase small subunit